MSQGGLHRGGRGGGRPPQPEHWGGMHRPPNFRLQYKGVPKSPLLSLFCNTVYWLKPHNNVNSRPPNLAVLPPPLNDNSVWGYICLTQTYLIKTIPTRSANTNTMLRRIPNDVPIAASTDLKSSENRVN